MSSDSNIKQYSLLTVLIILTFTACNSLDSASNSTQDDNKSIRIITLAPHLAELTASAGAIDMLVGVVAYSDFPKEVKDIQQVGDAFKLDYETIITLKPDFLLSWKDGTPVAVTEKLKSLNLTVITTEINTLADIPKTIAQIAELTNTQEVAKRNIEYFQNKILQFKQQDHKATTIFIEISPKPLYTISKNHWMSEAASICGYQNIFHDLPQLSAPVSLEAVISRNPQSILNISGQIDDQWQKWDTLDAIKNKQVFTISPDIFSRPSLRLLEGISQLCDF